MDTTKIEKELLELEKRYWQAIKDKRVDVCLALTDDPCIVAGPSGVSRVDKKALESMMKSQRYTLDDFRLTEPQVRVLGEDVAVLAYKVHEDLSVDGEKVSVDAADASTWIRRNGKWVCAMHTETIAGDPYGRRTL